MPQLLPSICALIGTIPIGFGVNAFLRPDNALSFFNGASLPTINANLVQALLMIYAARDIFMGIAIYATAYYGSRRALGWVMLAAGFNAFIDGLAVKTYLGGGECKCDCCLLYMEADRQICSAPNMQQEEELLTMCTRGPLGICAHTRTDWLVPSHSVIRGGNQKRGRKRPHNILAAMNRCQHCFSVLPVLPM
jgi:hypothetical protein